VLKGSVLGPMVIGGICFFESKLDILYEIAVKDSKKLSPKKRTEFAKILKKKCQSYELLVVSAEEIDQRKSSKITLNRLEELKMAEIINKMKPDIIYIDAADVNEERFGNSIKSLLNYKPKKVISKHKADDLYPIVSAGSIIAKEKRDALIQELKGIYGDIGSGYPSDERTIKFLIDYLIENKKAPKIARKSWNTTKRLINENIATRKITDYLN